MMDMPSDEVLEERAMKMVKIDSTSGMMYFPFIEGETAGHLCGIIGPGTINLWAAKSLRVVGRKLEDDELLQQDGEYVFVQQQPTDA